MKFRSLLTAICVLAAAQIVSAAPYAYIANSGTKNVSVIDTAITPAGDGSNTITATVTLPDDNGATLPNPYAYSITVGASGQKVYVGLQETNEVVVIDAATNTVAKRIALLSDRPGGLAVNAAETRLYVAVNNSNTLRVIDISGTSASEVGRVTVSDSAQSAPEGVVLNSAGTRAYVANSAPGLDSVAEITLNEGTNTYTRSSLINTGVGSNPFGLAMNSSDDTKLYFSSLNGHAGIVDLSASPKTVTPMETDTGNISVAVNPAGPAAGNVYAPSSAYDLLYAFNATGTPLGSYASASSPWGISVTPSGAKLFVAMNLSDTVKVYATENLATAPASIALPAGAKPTSLGKFIGPEWPYTINASASAPCTISPEGAAVPVNGSGRTFTISNPDCRAKIPAGGSFVAPDSGTTDSYTITNVTDNSKTIEAAKYLFTLTANVTGGDPGGYLINTTPLPEGTLDTLTTPSAKFAYGSTVTIKAGTNFKAQNWTGDCAFANPSDTCTFTNLNADKTFGAEVIEQIGGPIYNVTKAEWYLDWTGCTAVGAAADYDVIKVSTDPSVADLTTAGTAGYMYKMSSQWLSSDYSIKDTYHPLKLTITNIGVIADDLVL